MADRELYQTFRVHMNVPGRELYSTLRYPVIRQCTLHNTFQAGNSTQPSGYTCTFQVGNFTELSGNTCTFQAGNSNEPQGSRNKLKMETGPKQALTLLLFVSWSFLHTAEFILKLQVAQDPLKQDISFPCPLPELVPDFLI